MDFVLYALCKKYVKKTAVGLGAVIGAPCTIKSIALSPDGKTNIVTFEWEGTDGSKKTSTMNVKNGTVTEVTSHLNTGVKIATVTVDGVSTDIYAPEGGPGGGVELTQAEYDALSEDEKLNGTVYYITDGQGGGGGGSANLTADLNVTQNVGGIHNGDLYHTGDSLEKILRDMLSPVLYPTLTNPSASISVSGSKILETGSTISKTFTVSFNRGSINPAYGTSGYRSGPATDYSLNGGTVQSSNTFTETVSESNKTFRGTVNYSSGEQPKDSSGANYSTPLAAGSVNSNTITYEFYNCLWSNENDITTPAKLAVVSKSTGVKQFNFPATTETYPELFDVPAGFNKTAIEVLNSLSGQWEAADDQFTASSVTHEDAAGATVNYVRYTCNLGMDIGDRSVRVKWN